jgi:uncharacterized membrane protein YbhN (UPF0104 family)
VWRAVQSLLVVVAFAAGVEYFVGWGEILAPWAYRSPGFIAATAGLLLFTYLVRTLRIYRYFKRQLELSTCLRMFVQHNMLLNTLPMRAGEFAFPVLMKRYFDMPANRSVPALVWLRLLDLHALALIVALASGLVLSWPVAAVLAGGLLAAPVFALPHAGKLVALLESRSPRAARLIEDGLSALPDSTAELVEQWLWTMLAWLVKVGVFGWIIATFASTPIGPSVMGAVGGELIAVVPLHGPASLGTYESGIVAVMLAFGIPFRRALYGAVNLHLLVLCVSILAGLGSLLIPARGALRQAKDAAASAERELPRAQHPHTVQRHDDRRADVRQHGHP